jgi:hypothetical protein
METGPVIGNNDYLTFLPFLDIYNCIYGASAIDFLSHGMKNHLQAPGASTPGSAGEMPERAG